MRLDELELAALKQAYRHRHHELAVLVKENGKTANRDLHASLESLARRGLLQRWRTDATITKQTVFYVYKLTKAGIAAMFPEESAA